MGGYKWLVLLLLISCAQSAQNIVDQDSRVTAFLDVFPESTYSQVEFSQSNIAAISDVIANDCPDVSFASDVTRATYQSPAATLNAYVADSEVRCVASRLNQAAFEVQQGDPTTVESGVLVTVNGDEITQDNLNNFYAQLDPQIAAQIQQTSVINTLIDQKLLLQAASEVNIPDSQVQTQLKQAAQAQNLSVDELVEAANVEKEVLEDDIRTQLQINSLLDGADAQVTQEQARQFYLENPNLFLVGEQVQFRQILISFNKSGSRESAIARLQQVLDSQEDFCTLAKQYSDDVDTKDTCNSYIVARGTILPELESALFSMQDGQSSVVESANGFHIVVRTGHSPANVVSYSDAQSQVMAALRQSVREQQLQVYLIKLRAQAEIIDYT